MGLLRKTLSLNFTLGTYKYLSKKEKADRNAKEAHKAVLQQNALLNYHNSLLEHQLDVPADVYRRADAEKIAAAKVRAAVALKKAAAEKAVLAARKPLPSKVRRDERRDEVAAKLAAMMRVVVSEVVVPPQLSPPQLVKMASLEVARVLTFKMIDDAKNAILNEQEVSPQFVMGVLGTNKDVAEHILGKLQKSGVVSAPDNAGVRYVLIVKT